MAQLINSGTYISRKADGTVNALGKVYTYAAGTLTPIDSYTTATGDVAQTNPVILGADGCAAIHLSPSVSYRVREYTAADVLIRDIDGIVLGSAALSGNITYTPAGSGVASRTVEGKLQESVSLSDFAGGTDTLKLTAALTSIGSSGKALFIDRDITITSMQDLPDADVTVYGYGATITCPTSSYVFRRVHRGRLFKMSGLRFEGAGAAFRYAQAAAVHGTQYLEYQIDRCVFAQDAGYYAIALIGAREGQIRDCYFLTGDGIYASYSINTEVMGCHFKNCGNGIYYDVGSEGLWMQGGVSLGCTIMVQAWQSAGVRIDGVTMDYNDTSVLIRGCSSVTISSSYITGRNSAPAIKVTSSGAVRSGDVKIVNNEIASNDTMALASDCVLVEDTDDYLISGNTVFNWKVRGIKSGNGCTQGKMVNNTIRPKTTTTAGSFVVGGYYTIASVGTTDFTLIGAGANTIGVSFTATGVGTGTGTADVGQYSIVTGTGDSTIAIVENTAYRPMSLTGTRLVSRNDGWATDASGEATFTSGSSVYNIPHGLAMTPVKALVQLRPTSVVGTATQWFVSATDATNIEVTFNAAISTNVGMAWQARIRP